VNPSGGGAGDLVITIGGDITPFETALAQLPQAAQDAFTSVQAASQTIDWADVAAGTDAASESLANLGAAASATEGDFTGTSGALETVSSSADDATAGAEQLTPALQAAGDAAAEAGTHISDFRSDLIELGEGLAVAEGVKAFADDALTAAGAWQNATIALTALTGSTTAANQKMAELEELAAADALSMPNVLLAATRMTAIGVPLDQLNTLITDAAGSADVMQTSFSRVVMQMDNMINSGTVAATTLSRMGISTQGFLAALNSVAGQGVADISNMAGAFQQLDKSQRIAVMEAAMQTFGAVVQQQAQSITGQLQTLDDEWEAVMKDFGMAIAPVTQGLVAFVSTDVIPTIHAMVTGFAELPVPVQQLAVSIGVLAIGAGLGAAALGVFSLSMAALTSEAVTGPIIALGASFSALIAPISAAVASFLGLDAAVGTLETVALPALIPLLALVAAVFAGWQLGHWLSDVVNNLDGFTAAQQKAAAEVSNTSEVAGTSSTTLKALGVSTDTAAESSSVFSKALSALGVNLDDITQKGKIASVVLLSFTAAAQQVATTGQNIQTTYQNAALVFNDTAKAMAAGALSATEYTTNLDALNKAQMAANGGLQDAITAQLMAADAFSKLNVAAVNATTDFKAVASAFASGHASLSEYTAALNAMVKAQEDANNGLISFGNALLVAQNAFQLIQVAATNAATNLAAVSAAVDAGTASWTQYMAALTALNKAQMDASGGLEQLGTAMALVDAGLETLAIDSRNAETNFQAVVNEMARGEANATQYTAALTALIAAHEKLQSGMTNLADQLLLVANNQAQANVAFFNASTALQAAYEYYQKTGQGVEQLISLTQKLVAAQEAASNGIISYVSADEQLNAQQAQLTIALQNANTVLAQAQKLYEDGSISLGVYDKAVAAAKAAQDALNGTHTATAAAATAAANATTSLGNAMKSLGTTAEAVADGPVSHFATSLQMINGQWVQLGGQAPALASSFSDVGAGVSMVNGQMVTLSTNSTSAGGSLNTLGDVVSQVDGKLVKLGGDAAGAASGISSVGSAAVAATGQVKTLAQEINDADKQMVDAFDSLNGATMSLNLGANSLVSQRNPSWFGSEGALGNSMPLLPGQQPYNTTQEIVNSTATMSAAVDTATTAVTALGTAATTSTAAVVTNYNQFGQLTDQFGNVITATVPAITTLATAATTAATATAASTAAMNALNTATATVTQGAIAAATAIAQIGTATEPFVAALTGIGHILGVGGGNTGVPTIGLPTGTYVVPSGGANGGVGGPNSMLNTGYSPTVGGGPITLTVNLQGSVLTGANGMAQLTQQISAAMVNELARRGIRMTRG
jgi:trimeric autotransporter adhesin